MTTDQQMRMERITRLLEELKYECHRGFMGSEIDESIGFEFIVPVSRQIPGGVVYGRFQTRPVHRDSILGQQINDKPRLKLVGADSQDS